MRVPFFTPAAWAYLWRSIAKKRGALLLIMTLGAAESAINLPMLALLRHAFDTAIPRGDIARLFAVGAGLVGVRLFAAALSLSTRALSLRVSKAAVRDIRFDLLASLYAAQLDFFGHNDPARLQTRIVQETERIDNLTSSLLSSVLPAILTSMVLASVVLYLNWQLTLALAVLLPLVWGATMLGGRYVKREVQSFQKDFETFARGVHFVLRQMELTRARGYEERELARQGDSITRLEKSGTRMAMSFAINNQILSGLSGVGGMILLVGGGVAVAHHAMTIGELLAFYVAAGLLNGSLLRIISVQPDIIAANESLTKLLALRADYTPIAYRGATDVSFDRGVSLRNVSFGHAGDPLLENVSFEIGRRDNIAIIGPNGAGKSTIVNLILGFYRPDRGDLRIGDLAYDEADLRALRRSIGVVLQKPTFFPGTVAENIGYGWPNATRADIEEAAARAGADSFIRNLANGYDTQIGEGGALVSGGEAQRLAIARALIGKPKLLILDEPTNHLDAEAVSRLMRRLTAEEDRPAILTISHDPAVVAFADIVLKLERRQLTPIRSALNASPIESAT